MDAAQVGERSRAGNIFPDRTLEEWQKAETTWELNYYEPENWVEWMKEKDFTLVASYDADKDLELYRFELDESKRDRIKRSVTFMNHFVNMLFRPSGKAHTDKVTEYGKMMKDIRK